MFTSNGPFTESPRDFPSLDTQPTVFEVPSPFTLDRFILSFTGHPQTQFSQSHRSSIPPPSTSTEIHPDAHLRTRSHVTEALHAALNSGIKSGSITPTEDTHATFHSNGSSVSLSISLKSVPTSQGVSRTMSDTEQTNLEFGTNVDIPSEATSETGPPTNEELQAEAQLPSVDSIPTLPYSTDTPSFILGNMFMSSCPGKKGMDSFTVNKSRLFILFVSVRLKGPVKGRSGVCRDLYADLQRMKDLAVGCVVW